MQHKLKTKQIRNRTVGFPSEVDQWETEVAEGQDRDKIA